MSDKYQMILRSVFCLLIAALMSGVPAYAHHDAHTGHEAMPEKGRPLGVSVAFDARGRLWLARVVGQHLFVSVSDDLGKHFSEPVRVNAAPVTIPAERENRPKIAIGADGSVHVSYTQSLPGQHLGYIRYSHSTDGGNTFSAPVTVNRDTEIIGHQFDTLLLDGEDRPVLAWIDQRERTVAAQRGEKYVGTAIYYAVASGNGVGFTSDRKLADHSCECCRIALARDNDGVPVAFWRHVFDGNVRDFALARLDGKNILRRASDDGWVIEACPHHGGAFAIDTQGRYHLAWFSNAPDAQGLFYRFSADRGASFSPPRAFGDNEAQAGHPVVLAVGGAVYLAWREFDGKRTNVMAMRSADGGTSWSASHRVADTADAADYPLLVARGEQPFLVWNTASSGLRLVDLSTELAP